MDDKKIELKIEELEERIAPTLCLTPPAPLETVPQITLHLPERVEMGVAFPPFFEGGVCD